jgi:superfamily II DNA/RNA helicase
MHGRTIVFADTKKEANELGLSQVIRQECQVLHGDIPQKQREVTLAQFREGPRAPPYIRESERDRRRCLYRYVRTHAQVSFCVCMCVCVCMYVYMQAPGSLSVPVYARLTRAPAVGLAGKVRCLVATDVAARGLDIPEVDLVVQTEPPEKAEDYVHRAGRTGRAGKRGVCVVFYKPTQEWALRNIETRTGMRFRRIGAPQSADIVRASARDARRTLERVSPAVLPYFEDVAQELIDERGAVQALAAALAEICGQRDAIEACAHLSSPQRERERERGRETR